MIAKTRFTFNFLPKTLFVLVYMILWQNTFAQEKNCNCFIHGEVIDRETQKPIAGAIVLIKDINKATATDENGHYHIDKLCHQKYTILTKIIGYQETTSLVDLNHKETHEEDFSLKEDELHLDHVEIKAKKIEAISQSICNIEATELLKTRGQTLGEALKQITGVTTLQTGSSISKPVIHGMHSNRVLIMNNGIRQEGQQWGSEHAPEIDPFVAKKVSVLKGAAGVRYGSDAIAGVILLEPEPLPDSTHLKGEINSIFFSNGNQGVLSGILERGFKIGENGGNSSPIIGIRIQGTAKRGGDISTPAYRMLNTGVSEINYSLAAGYDSKKSFSTELFFSQFNTKIGVFAGSHIGNVTDLVEAIKRGKPLEVYLPTKFSYTIGRPYQDLQHNLLKFKAKNRFSSGNQLTLTLGRQYNFRREVDVLRGDKNLVQRYMLTSYTSELLFEHRPIFKIMTGVVGFSGNFQENITSGSYEKPTSSTVLIPNFRNLIMGVFWIERMVKEKWDVEAGLRTDYRHLSVNRIPRGTQKIESNEKTNANLTSTFGVGYRPTSQIHLMFNTASAWRPPTVNELYSDGVHHGAASFEQGNENLKPEKALNTSLTVNYTNQKVQIELHGYWNRIKDFLFLSPTGRAALTIRGAFPEFFYTQTNAVFRGVDFSSEVQLNSVFSWKNKTSFLQANDISNNQPLIMIPANRIENSLNIDYKKINFSVTNLYVLKQNRAPNLLIFNNIPENELIFKDFGGDFAAPPAAYSLWGISVSREFYFQRRQKLFVNLSIQNLMNTTYRDYLNRFRYYSDEIGRNAAFRLRYEF